MGRGGLFALSGHAAHHDDDGLGGGDFFEGLQKLRSTTDVLEIHRDHPGVWIPIELLERVRLVDPRLVPERIKRRKTKSTSVEHVCDRDCHGSRLGDDPDISPIKKLTPKGEIQGVPRIRKSETIWAQYRDIICFCDALEACLSLGVAYFLEACCDNDGFFYPSLPCSLE